MRSILKVTCAAGLVFCALDVVFAQIPREVRSGSLQGDGTDFRAVLPASFSESFSSAGDVNGDGLDDFFLQTYSDEEPETNVVSLVLGRRDFPATVKGGDLAAYSTQILRTEPRFQASDLLHGAVRAGDLDGDGFDDVFVLRPEGALVDWLNLAVTPGVVYLVHGGAQLPAVVDLDLAPAQLRVSVFTASRKVDTFLGRQAASGGDMNGDGVLDVALAAPGARTEDDLNSPRGRVYVLLGQGSWPSGVDVEEAGGRLPGFIIEGTRTDQSLGMRLCFVGDANGDGFGDLLLGSYLGEAFLVLGGSTLNGVWPLDVLVSAGRIVRFTATGTTSYENGAVASLGDLNRDGLADFAFGNPSAKGTFGAAYVVFGQNRFADQVEAQDLDRDGLGAVILGESISTRISGSGSFAGVSLSSLDFDADGSLDLLVGSHFGDLRLSRKGKVYVVSGAGLSPGSRHSLGDIEAGLLPGAVVTTEVQEWLGRQATLAGDVDGDGADDLLCFATRTKLDGVTSIYLVRGGTQAGRLRLEEARPAEAPLGGGVEVTLVGSGFDASTTVRIGGREARVTRVVTTSRIIVEAPPGERLGSVDIAVRSGPEEALLAGGLRYVPRFFADLQLEKPLRPEHGFVVRGKNSLRFAASVALLDFDNDGFSDVAAPAESSRVLILHGRARSPAEIVVEAGADPPQAGGAYSLIDTSSEYSSVRAVGDVSGDGIADLALLDRGALTLLFGGIRLPALASTKDLVDEGRGAVVLLNGGSGWLDLRVGSGSDLDGDGIGDLAVGWADRFQGTFSRVHVLRGSREWSRERFIEDTFVVLSTEPEDLFGEDVALLPDLNGDDRGELLVGAPGHFHRDPGRAYLLSPDSITPGADVLLPDLLEVRAVRFEAIQSKDGLGFRVCSPGDFDGDGEIDLAFCALRGGPELHGETYVVFGGPWLEEAGGRSFGLADLGGRSVRITGEWSNDYASEIAPAGDFDGDGRSDILIGASVNSQRYGRAYVVLGGPSRKVSLDNLGGNGLRIIGKAGYRLGSRIAGGGDFNGDGLGDVVLGSAPEGTSTDDPLLYVLFGQPSTTRFVRGDSNVDGKVDLSDAVFLLGHLFLGGALPRCDDAGDGNDDGAIDITDAIFVLAHLFLWRALASGAVHALWERSDDRRARL